MPQFPKLQIGHKAFSGVAFPQLCCRGGGWRVAWLPGSRTPALPASLRAGEKVSRGGRSLRAPDLAPRLGWGSCDLGQGGRETPVSPSHLSGLPQWLGGRSQRVFPPTHLLGFGFSGRAGTFLPARRDARPGLPPPVSSGGSGRVSGLEFWGRAEGSSSGARALLQGAVAEPSAGTTRPQGPLWRHQLCRLSAVCAEYSQSWSNFPLTFGFSGSSAAIFFFFFFFSSFLLLKAKNKTS